MDLTLTDEQRDLRAVMREFVAAQPAGDLARQALDGQARYDPATWRELVRIGVLDPVLPEGLGGDGGGLRELAVVAAELGRALLCVPFLPVAGLAAGVLIAAAERDQGGPAEEMLRRVVADGVAVTVAWLPRDGRWEEPLTFACRARRDGGESWVVTGEAMFVPFGTEAELVLAPVATPDGPAVLAVEGEAPGLVREPMPTVDATRPQARMTFADVAATTVVGADATAILEAALDRAGVLLAAEQLGTAERAMEMAVGYARLREQFGRLIGSFQAVKHLCADMLVGVESLRSAVRAAAWAIDAAAPDRAVLASLAQAVASQVAAEVTDAALHVHGGIGFTWEHDAHLYLRRALGDAVLLGNADYHRVRLADRAGL